MGFKTKKYYTLMAGNSDRRIICRSWAEVKAHTNGVSRGFLEGFDTLAEALFYASGQSFQWPLLALKEVTDEASLQPTGKAYYAAADGRNAGVYPVYHNGAESQISEYTGASHKLCKTMSQADAFIEDWKNVVADGYRTAIKKLLDGGIRPGDMKIEKRAKDMLFKDYTLNEGANTMEPEPLETSRPMEIQEEESRGELKQELNHELKAKLKNELEELKRELKQELKQELKNELKNEFKHELKEELQKLSKGELNNE